MAEALGVAASGIAVAQIAIQVGGAVVKLKQLWDEVKNVPDDIADLMDQIDCLDPILWEAENGFSRCDSPSMLWDDLASKSMTVYCRKALQNLTGIVDELNHQITNAKKGRRKITAIKVLLKKDSIQKLQKRLENAVQMLILAQQSYLVALQRVQPDIIIQKFTALTALTAPQTQSGSQLIPDSTSKNKAQIALTECHEEADISRTATKPQWVHSTGWIMPCYFGRVCIESFGSSRKFLFQSPLWLSQRSWELHSNKALGAWKWNLKSYKVVPSNSKIIKLTQRGSPKDVQKLFNAGLASPYDRDERGWTLLHYAVAWSNFEMTKYLMAIGVSPREPDDMRWYPAQLIDSNDDDASQTLDFLKQVLSDTSLAKKLLVYPTRNTDDDNKETHLLSCNCAEGYLHPELYMALLPYQCPYHQSTSLPSRLRQAEYFLENIGNINSVKAVLEPDWSANRKAIFCDFMYPMIHPTVYALMQITSILVIRWNTDDWRYLVEKQNNYLAFAVEVIKLTPDLHISHPVLTLGKDGWEITALQYAVHTAVFASCSVYYDFYFHIKPFNLMIMEWLKALALAGVDLEAYGRREYAILLDDYSLRYIVAYSHSYSGILRLKIYLIRFKFGPKPEDWEFYFNEPTDEFAGDFWKLVEDPPLRIPGAWVEDDGC